MNAKVCLEKMNMVGVLAFATVDKNGDPQIRNVSAIHYEAESIYFFTARGKNFCQELLNNGKVQVLGYTKYKEMIRLSGIAEPVSDEEQNKWIRVIFEEQPYLANIYPGDSREIGIIFCIKDAEIEYFNLGVNPIFRETYTIGNAQKSRKGYWITNRCIRCGKCSKLCPQKCIEEGTPYKIHSENCLHCGRCEENCSVDAIERL